MSFFGHGSEKKYKTKNNEIFKLNLRFSQKNCFVLRKLCDFIEFLISKK
jgi:hypothetical protein